MSEEQPVYPCYNPSKTYELKVHGNNCELKLPVDVRKNSEWVEEFRVASQDVPSSSGGIFLESRLVKVDGKVVKVSSPEAGLKCNIKDLERVLRALHDRGWETPELPTLQPTFYVPTKAIK